MARHEVNVGNIGTVYDGEDADEAGRTYSNYLDQSRSEKGRAGGESVEWWIDGGIHMQHTGRLGPNGAPGTAKRADAIRGRISLLEPTPQDNNDGTYWLLEVHVPEACRGEQIGNCPKFNKDNVTAGIIVGNEDAPDEIWLTLERPVNYNSRFWRVK